MKENNIDFMSLSETKTTPKNQSFFYDSSIKAYHNPHELGAKKGVITLIAPSLMCHFTKQTDIIPGHCSQSTFKLQGRTLNIFSLYGPNESNMVPFLEQIINDKYLDNPEDNIFIGDWNLLQCPMKDRTSKTQYQKLASSNKLKELMEEYSLIDPWRQSNPEDILKDPDPPPQPQTSHLFLVKQPKSKPRRHQIKN